MGQQKRFIKNVIFVIISNLLTVFSGILTGFLIPKIMGVEEYGFYKTFTLYSTYVGVFHFGLADGILLKFAGSKTEDLDKKHFRMLSRFFIVLETIIAGIGIGVSLLFLPDHLKYIFAFVAANLFVLNVTTYFEFIVQATMHFKQLSIKSMIRTALQVAAIGIICLLFFTKDIKTEVIVYISIYVGINFLLLFWYLIAYRSFVFGKAEKFSFKAVWPYFKNGIPLTLSNLVVIVILAIDQLFVNILFTTEEYAIYAFSYSMISLITTATSAISTVLFPTLKEKNSNNPDEYTKFSSYMFIFAALCLAAYHVFCVIVWNFLDKYVDSLEYLRIIIPTILITAPISVVKYNFYKKENMILPYFFISLIILGLSIVADIIVYYIFKNMISISIVSIIVCVIWYVVVDLYYCRKKNQPMLKNLLFLLIALGGFYGDTFIPNIYLSFGSYLLFIGGLITVFYYKEIKELIARRKEKQ